MFNIHKTTKIFLVVLLAQVIWPVLGQAVSKNKKSYIRASSLQAIEFLSGLDSGLNLHLFSKDSTIDLEKREAHLRLAMNAKPLLSTGKFPQSFKIETFRYNDAGEKQVLAITTPTLVNRKQAKKSYFKVDIDHIQESEYVYFDVYNTDGELFNSYRTYIVISSNSSQSTKELSGINCKGDNFGDCQIEYLLQKVKFEAVPQNRPHTSVKRELNGTYTVSIPVMKQRKKAARYIGRKIKNNQSSRSGSSVGSASVDLSNVVTFDNLGRVSIGAGEASGYMHIKGGTQNFPSLILEPGQLITNKIDGAIEYDGSNLYFTVNGTRSILGAKGDKGDKGDTGPSGPIGIQGPQGPAGPAGGGGSFNNGGTINAALNFTNNGFLQDPRVNGSLLLSNLSSAPSATQGYGTVFVNGNTLFFIDNGGTQTNLLLGGGSNGAPASGVAGAIQFSDGSNAFNSDAANLFWDNTNDRLGVGINSPAADIHVEASSANEGVYINQTGVLGANNHGLYLHSNVAQVTDTEGLAYIWQRNASSTQPALGVNNVGTGDSFYVADEGTKVFQVGDNGSVSITQTKASEIGLTVQGAPSHSANLQEWYQGVTRRAYIDSVGGMHIGDLVLGASANESIRIPSTGNMRHQVRGYYEYFADTNDNDGGSTNIYRWHTRDGAGTGTPKMVFTNNGLLGISHISPNEKLTVNGSLSLLSQSSAPSATEGFGKLFVNGNSLYFMDNGGTQTALGGGSSSSGATGSVQFSDGSGSFNSNGNNFFWDNTNRRLGIGTNSPSYPLHVLSTANTSFYTGDGNEYAAFGQNADHSILTVNTANALRATMLTLNNSADGNAWQVGRAGNGTFTLNLSSDASLDSGTIDDKFVILSSGNIGMGTNSPDANLDLVSRNVSRIGLIVQGKNGQTANLTEWHDNGGTILASINPSGLITSDGGFRTNTGDKGIGLGVNPSGSYNEIISAGSIVFDPIGTDAVYIKGEDANSSNRFGWITSASSLINSFSSDVVNGAVLTWNADTTTGFVLKSRASQVANIFEVRDSSNNDLIIIDNGGNLGFKNLSSAPDPTEGFGKIFVNGNSLYFMDNGGTQTALGAGGASSSGAAGSVQLSDGSGGLTSNANNLFWDSTNARLGIGTNSPSVNLHVDGAMLVNNEIHFVDSNTRIYHSGGDLRFRVDGTTDFLTLEDSGNLGIGTNTPSALLEVNGSAIFNEAGGNNDFRIEGDTDTDLFFVDASADNIGIGTNSPEALLHIEGSSADNDQTPLKIKHSLTGLGVGDTAGLGFTFGTAKDYARIAGRFEGSGSGGSGGLVLETLPAGGTITERMRILSGGNVGIGIQSPTTLLDVNGSLMVHSTIVLDEIVSNTSAGAVTVNWNNGNKQTITMAHNITFTFTAPAGPASLVLVLKQDATGSRTATWPAAVKWPNGTAPTLTTAASSTDAISCLYDGTEYLCQSGLNFQ